MPWKADHPVFDGDRALPASSEEAPTPDTAFPTPGAVLGEMALTIAVFLAIALLLHRLADSASF